MSSNETRCKVPELSVGVRGGTYDGQPHRIVREAGPAVAQQPSLSLATRVCCLLHVDRTTNDKDIISIVSFSLAGVRIVLHQKYSNNKHPPHIPRREQKRKEKCFSTKTPPPYAIPPPSTSPVIVVVPPL